MANRIVLPSWANLARTGHARLVISYDAPAARNTVRRAPSGGAMNARAALFALYGDHLRERGGAASISAVTRLLDALDTAAPAVRTAVSRMVRQGAARARPGPGG